MQRGRLPFSAAVAGAEAVKARWREIDSSDRKKSKLSAANLHHTNAAGCDLFSKVTQTHTRTHTNPSSLALLVGSLRVCFGKNYDVAVDTLLGREKNCTLVRSPCRKSLPHTHAPECVCFSAVRDCFCVGGWDSDNLFLSFGCQAAAKIFSHVSLFGLTHRKQEQ